MPMPTITMSARIVSPVGQADAADAAVLVPSMLATVTPRRICDAVRAVLGFVEPRQRLAGDAGKHPVHRLQHRDALAQLGQHGRGFEADVSAADDHDMRWRSGTPA